MTDLSHCESIRDRMPDVAHGRTPWRASDLDHLDGCAECQREWALVEAGASMEQGTVVDTAAIAMRLRARIAADGVLPVTVLPLRPRRRIASWGLIAAAASVALIFGLQRPSPRSPALAAPMEVSALLPELENLSESQLEAVLSEVEASNDGDTPMRLPRLGDLTERELESLLNEMEG